MTRDKLCDISVDAESKSTVQFLCTLSPQTAIEKGDYLIRLMTLNWANDATSFEAETAYFSPAGSGDLPPAGEYVADITFHRAGGSEGGEDLVVHDVTITVS